MPSPNMALFRSSYGSLVLFLSLSLSLTFLHALETFSPGDTPVETTYINQITSPPDQGAETTEKPKNVTYINRITSPPDKGAETTEKPKNVTYINRITSPAAQDEDESEDVPTAGFPTSMDGTTDVGQPAEDVTQDAAVTEDTAVTDVTTSSSVHTIESDSEAPTLANTQTTAVPEEEGSADVLTMTVSETALITTDAPTDALTTTTTTLPAFTVPQTASIPPGSDLATTVAVDDDAVKSLTPSITSAPSQLSPTTPLTTSHGGPILMDTTISPPPSTASPPPVHTEDKGYPVFWIVIVALLIGVMCVGGVICICLFVKCRRRSQSKQLGFSGRSGKWTRKSKGRGEGDEAWAGPVKLRGEECDGGREAGKAEEAVRDEAAVVLSTFATEGERGEGGGPRSPVGEEGSKEVKIWEQEAPLLYIDEDAFDEGLMRANNTNCESDREIGGETWSEKGTGGREGVGNGLSMGEMNGGSAFCLTTAV